MRNIRQRKYWRRTAMVAAAWTLAELLGLTLVLAPSSADAQVNVTVVMSGLDNPRGLAFGPDGGLYVAEAGRGGTGPSIVLPPTKPCSMGQAALSADFWAGCKSAS